MQLDDFDVFKGTSAVRQDIVSIFQPWLSRFPLSWLAFFFPVFLPSSPPLRSFKPPFDLFSPFLPCHSPFFASPMAIASLRKVETSLPADCCLRRVMTTARSSLSLPRVEQQSLVLFMLFKGGTQWCVSVQCKTTRAQCRL